MEDYKTAAKEFCEAQKFMGSESIGAFMVYAPKFAQHLIDTGEMVPADQNEYKDVLEEIIHYWYEYKKHNHTVTLSDAWDKIIKIAEEPFLNPKIYFDDSVFRKLNKILCNYCSSTELTDADINEECNECRLSKIPPAPGENNTKS